MPRSPRLSSIAVVVLVLAGIAAWEYRAAQSSLADLSAANRKRDALLLESKSRRASLAKMTGEGNQLKPAEPAAEAPIKDLDTAEQSRKRARILRAWINLRYGPFGRKAGLTPDQIARLEAITADHYMRSQDIYQTARAENLPPADPAFTPLWKEDYSQYYQDQAALLGAQGAKDLKQYERTSSAGELTDAVAGNTFFNGSMNSQQAAQLTQILANNSAAYQKGQNASTEDLDFPAVLAQAQTVLSPDQLAALQNLHDGKEAGAKLSALIAPSAGGPPPAAAPGK